MNRLEELLIILQEECSEVAQVASKCIRFGIDSVYMGESNRTRLEREVGDLLAMVKLISEVTELDADRIMNAAEAKLIKVERFMDNSNNKPKRKPRSKPKS